MDQPGTEANAKAQVLTVLLHFPKSYSIQEKIVLHNDKYRQIYDTFFESYSNRGQILMHEHNYSIIVI